MKIIDIAENEDPATVSRPWWELNRSKPEGAMANIPEVAAALYIVALEIRAAGRDPYFEDVEIEIDGVRYVQAFRLLNSLEKIDRIIIRD